MMESRCSAAVVFDWDGTLFDTDFLLDLAIKRTLKHRGSLELERLSALLFRAVRPVSPLKHMRLPEMGRATTVHTIGREFRQLDEQACAFEGITELLLRLRATGIPLAILTRRDRQSLTQQLKRSELDDVFSLILCRGEVPAKPHPEGLSRIRKQLQVDRLVMIGNSMQDLECAQRAQADFIAVKFCSRVEDDPFAAAECRVLTHPGALYESIMQAVVVDNTH